MFKRTFLILSFMFIYNFFLFESIFLVFFFYSFCNIVLSSLTFNDLKLYSSNLILKIKKYIKLV